LPTDAGDSFAQAAVPVMHAVVPETPASPEESFVPATPAAVTQRPTGWSRLSCSRWFLLVIVLRFHRITGKEETDKVAELVLLNNKDKMRKRRLSAGLSPEIQVPNKFRLVNARLNITQLLSQE
jgi:hypothetical protein